MRGAGEVGVALAHAPQVLTQGEEVRVADGQCLVVDSGQGETGTACVRVCVRTCMNTQANHDTCVCTYGRMSPTIHVLHWRHVVKEEKRTAGIRQHAPIKRWSKTDTVPRIPTCACVCSLPSKFPASLMWAKGEMCGVTPPLRSMSAKARADLSSRKESPPIIAAMNTPSGLRDLRICISGTGVSVHVACLIVRVVWVSAQRCVCVYEGVRGAASQKIASTCLLAHMHANTALLPITYARVHTHTQMCTTIHRYVYESIHT